MGNIIEISQRSRAVAFYGRLNLQSGFTEDREATLLRRIFAFILLYITDTKFS